MMNFLDPELLSISKSKEMGIWSPGGLSSYGVLPYIKRISKPQIEILDVNTQKGENAYFLFENDRNFKIKSICGVQLDSTDKKFQPLLEENLKDYATKFSLDILKYEETNTKFNVVCINTTDLPSFELDMIMNLYYDYVCPNGIFCGNNHGKTEVKEALARLRRSKKIGIPINVSFDNFFWYVR